MAKITWSRRVIQDIYAAAEYHRTFSPSFADALIDRIFEKGALLETHPLLGRLVPEAKSADLRELLYKQYRIIYQVISDLEVVVVALHHGSQPLSVDTLFG